MTFPPAAAAHDESVSCTVFGRIIFSSLLAALPTEGTEDILDEGVLRELLAAVDLEYLLERVGMHAAVNWHDTLSLGASTTPCPETLLTAEKHATSQEVQGALSVML